MRSRCRLCGFASYMAQPARAVLSLGANLDDRFAALQFAVTELSQAQGVQPVAVSRVYQTAPVGGPEQPEFLNAVLIVDTTLAPKQLLALGHQVEQGRSRTREVRWGPRTLDVDIIDFDGIRSDDPVLTLPHPRARERAFVLIPWLDADPAAHIVGESAALADLLRELPDWQTVQIWRGSNLTLPPAPTLDE